jgi:hypothetical protein
MPSFRPPGRKAAAKFPQLIFRPVRQLILLCRFNQSPDILQKPQRRESATGEEKVNSLLHFIQDALLFVLCKVTNQYPLSSQNPEK